jgi:hypothetical protein
MSEEQGGASGTLQPVIIDLGKTKQKKIKDLKRGRGELLEKIDQIVAEAGAQAGADKEILPVVILYRKKAKRGGGMLFGR